LSLDLKRYIRRAESMPGSNASQISLLHPPMHLYAFIVQR